MGYWKICRWHCSNEAFHFRQTNIHPVRRSRLSIRSWSFMSIQSNIQGFSIALLAVVNTIQYCKKILHFEAFGCYYCAPDKRCGAAEILYFSTGSWVFSCKHVLKVKHDEFSFSDLRIVRVNVVCNYLSLLTTIYKN